MECQKNFTGKKDKTVSTETAWTELGEKEMENSMSKSKYVVILILCEILNMILFYCFIPKYKFNIGKINIPSCLLFGALVAGALVSGLLMTIKEERNLKSILGVVSLSLILYFDIFCWKSVKFWYCISLFGVFFMIIKKNRKADFYEERGRSNKFIRGVVIIVLLLIGAGTGYCNASGRISENIVMAQSKLENVSGIKLPSYEEWNA